MNVVLYMRYSSDKQTEQSIEGQERICTAYCQSHNMTIIGKYIDRALSASKHTEKRDEFQRMIRDSEKQTFEAVVVYKLDRFSRNRYDSAIYKNKLRKNGVKVVSATENISDSPEGIILESVLEGMAEFYSKELSQKVSRGMHETALKCYRRSHCADCQRSVYALCGRGNNLTNQQSVQRERVQNCQRGDVQHKLVYQYVCKRAIHRCISL